MAKAPLTEEEQAAKEAEKAAKKAEKEATKVEAPVAEPVEFVHPRNARKAREAEEKE